MPAFSEGSLPGSHSRWSDWRKTFDLRRSPMRLLPYFVALDSIPR